MSFVVLKESLSASAHSRDVVGPQTETKKKSMNDSGFTGLAHAGGLPMPEVRVVEDRNPRTAS